MAAHTAMNPKNIRLGNAFGELDPPKLWDNLPLYKAPKIGELMHVIAKYIFVSYSLTSKTYTK
jgi:hypothetical protein